MKTPAPAATFVATPDDVLSRMSSQEIHELYLKTLAEQRKLSAEMNKHEVELRRLRPLETAADISARGLHRRFLRAVEVEAKECKA